MVREVYYLGLEEGTFGGFQFKIELAEALQYYSKSFQVFFLCTAIHYHIVQVDDAVGQVQLPQHILHQTTEMSQACYIAQKASL